MAVIIMAAETTIAVAEVTIIQVMGITIAIQAIATLVTRPTRIVTITDRLIMDRATGHHIMVHHTTAVHASALASDLAVIMVEAVYLVATIIIVHVTELIADVTITFIAVIAGIKRQNPALAGFIFFWHVKEIQNSHHYL